jgi:hypothetical protein
MCCCVRRRVYGACTVGYVSLSACVYGVCGVGYVLLCTVCGECGCVRGCAGFASNFSLRSDMNLNMICFTCFIETLYIFKFSILLRSEMSQKIFNFFVLNFAPNFRFIPLLQ